MNRYRFLSIVLVISPILLSIALVKEYIRYDLIENLLLSLPILFLTLAFSVPLIKSLLTYREQA